MTITLTTPFLLLGGLSLLLFVGVTILCHWQGMFDGGGGYAGGLDGFFIVIAYAVFWAVPSLLVWAVWATWWRV
jgi:hypothetical protein